MIELYKKDAFAFLNTLQNNSVDLIFTDPPYWTLNKWRNIGTTTRLGGHNQKSKQSNWFNTIDSQELWELMTAMFRVLKDNRHAFIMCDGQTLKWVLGYSEEAGYSYYKTLIWDKVYLGMGYHFRNRHEYIVMLDKGKNRKPKNLSLSDIFQFPLIKNGYPTQKPLPLVNIFIQQFSEENELVIDPFFGSGTVAIACKENNRKFKGSDISDIAYNYAMNQLNTLGF